MSTKSDEMKNTVESYTERRAREEQEYLAESKAREEERQRRIREFDVEMASTMHNTMLRTLLALEAKTLDSKLTDKERKAYADQANQLNIALLSNTAALSEPNSVIRKELKTLKAEQRVNGRSKRELEFDRIFSVIFSKIGGQIDFEDRGSPEIALINSKYFPNESPNADYTKQDFPKILVLLTKFLALSKQKDKNQKYKMSERAFREAFARTNVCLDTLSTEQFLQIIKLFVDCREQNHFSLDKVDCDQGTLFGEVLFQKKWDIALGLMRYKLTSVMGSDLGMIWGESTVRTKMLVQGGNPTPPGHEKGEELMQACREGNADRARALIMKEGANSNYVDSFGLTPLIAAKNADTALAVMLPDMPILKPGQRPNADTDTAYKKMDFSKRANVNYLHKGPHGMGPRLSPLPQAILDIAKTGPDKVNLLVMPNEITKETLQMGLMEILSILEEGNLALQALNSILWRFKDKHSVEDAKPASPFYDSPWYGRSKTFDKESFSLRGGRRVYNPFNASFLGALVHRLMYQNTEIVTETIHQMIELMVKEGADVSCTDLLESNALFFAVENAEHMGTRVVKTLLASEDIKGTLVVDAHSIIPQLSDPKVKAELEEIFKPHMEKFAKLGIEPRLKPSEAQTKADSKLSIVSTSTAAAKPDATLSSTTMAEQKAQSEFFAADIFEICRAAQKAQTEGIEKLKQRVATFKARHGENANIHAYHKGLAAIHYAAQKGDVDSVIFLESQSNIDGLNLPSQLANKSTPLQYLTRAGKLDLFIERKAALDKTDAESIRKKVSSAQPKTSVYRSNTATTPSSITRSSMDIKLQSDDSKPKARGSVDQPEPAPVPALKISKATTSSKRILTTTEIKLINDTCMIMRDKNEKDRQPANLNETDLKVYKDKKQKEFEAAVAVLISNGLLNEGYTAGITALHFACTKNYFPEAVYLNEKGASLEQPAANGLTPNKILGDEKSTKRQGYNRALEASRAKASSSSIQITPTSPTTSAPASTPVVFSANDVNRYMRPKGTTSDSQSTTTLSPLEKIAAEYDSSTTQTTGDAQTHSGSTAASVTRASATSTASTGSSSIPAPILIAGEQYRLEQDNMDKLYNICRAASKNDLATVQELLPKYINAAQNCTVNTVYKDKNKILKGTIMHYACNAKAVETILYLETQGADINIKAAGKSTPLSMLMKDNASYTLYLKLKKDNAEASATASNASLTAAAPKSNG